MLPGQRGSASAARPRVPVPGICSIGGVRETRVVTETALSHGCCSPWLLSFPEEEKATSVLQRGGVG